MGELQELTKFIAECRKFSLRGSQHAINSVFAMIWRKDSTIIDLAVQAADTLFVQNPNGEIVSKRSVDNLMDVMMEASAEERLSLEETLVRVVEKKKRMPIQIVDSLWECVVSEEAEVEKRLAAVRLMSVFGRYVQGGAKVRQPPSPLLTNVTF